MLRYEKKGQMASEMLITYGVVICAVLFLFGALQWLGVFSVSSFVPDSCVYGTGIGCSDFRIAEDSISVSLTNGLGNSITIESVAFTMKDYSCSYLGSPIVVEPDQQVSITTSERCLFLTKGGKSKIKSSIAYTQNNGVYQQKILGDIVTST